MNDFNPDFDTPSTKVKAEKIKNVPAKNPKVKAEKVKAEKPTKVKAEKPAAAKTEKAKTEKVKAEKIVKPTKVKAEKPAAAKTEKTEKIARPRESSITNSVLKQSPGFAGKMRDGSVPAIIFALFKKPIKPASIVEEAIAQLEDVCSSKTFRANKRGHVMWYVLAMVRTGSLVKV